LRPKLFDLKSSLELSLAELVRVYADLGVHKIIYKRLSPNDNSKNQPYMAGHITDLGFLPTGEIQESKSTSGKTQDPKRKVKFSASLQFYWMSPEGQLYQAPNAKLIYYPQYPEVRLSGFLAGVKIDSGGWMDPAQKGRSLGRVLFFGICGDGSIYSFLAIPESRIAKEIDDATAIELNNIFREIPHQYVQGGDSKLILLQELKRIHLSGWIQGKRLNKYGKPILYTAPNGGGYTLEAELGVIPNGDAEPDYLGWEIKQFGVKRFDLINSKPLTVMTPEPDGGFYVEGGVEAFVREYGYPDNKGRKDRFNFNGRHVSGSVCKKTNLVLSLEGYDPVTATIVDSSGCIGLINADGEAVATWSFAKVLSHWKRKHSKAAYIPAISCGKEKGTVSYHYGNEIRLFEGANIVSLLKAINAGSVYYDPGIKLENAFTSPRTKRRSQFRIKSSSLSVLYHHAETVDVLNF
jgi:hypothetical protein